MSEYLTKITENLCRIESEEGEKIEAVSYVPPIYVSGNIDGGREHNIELEDLFLGRVKHL